MSKPSYLRFLIAEVIEQLSRPPAPNALEWRSLVGLATEIETTRQQLGISKQIFTFQVTHRSPGYFARVWPPWAEKGLQLALEYRHGPHQTPWQAGLEENRKTLVDVLGQWVRAVEADMVPRQDQVSTGGANTPVSDQTAEPLLDGDGLKLAIYRRFMELTEAEDHTPTEAYNVLASEYCYLPHKNRESLITNLRQLKKRGKTLSENPPHA